MELVLPFPAFAWAMSAVLGLVGMGSVRATALPQTGEVEQLVVARARRGDHVAFTQIVDHYDHRLRGLAFRLLGDRDRMDDVLQDAYFKAFRSMPRFKGESALGTWLYRIVYNACVDDLRARKPTVAFDERLDIADRRPDPADVAIGRQDLAAALDALPPDHKAVVLLVDAYGLDYAEAAGVLGVAAGTIGSRLNRARSTLRRLLGPER